MDAPSTSHRKLFSPASKWAIPIAALLCLHPSVSGGLALLLGVFLALSLGNPYESKTKMLTSRLLSLSVMGLGAGMNLLVVAKVGMHGFGYTIIGISITFLLGLWLERMIGVDRNTSWLITIGTAICGGSAIAAVSPVLRAKPNQVSVALGIVFMLNACALFIFPFIGHVLNLSQLQFGFWSALAIHDTSSVVGAGLQYGPQALEIGTTVKLARALWIVPVTFAVGLLVARQKDSAQPTEKAKRPWFILGFLIIAAIVTWVSDLQPIGHMVEASAKRLLVMTLFFIGTNLNREALRSVGFKPFLQGFVLWVIMGTGTLFAVYAGWIS